MWVLSNSGSKPAHRQYRCQSTFQCSLFNPRPGESVSEAVEFGNLNLLDPPLSHAHADVFFSCREVLAMVGFVHDVVAQDAESGTTGTDESQWSTLSSDRVFVEAVEEAVAPCKEAINIASPPSTSSAG